MKKHATKQKQETYRPGAAWFGFFIGIGSIAGGGLSTWYMLSAGFFSIIYVVYSVFGIGMGILIASWAGSFLTAKITIMDDYLLLEGAAKMPYEAHHIHLWQRGRHQVELRWDEIRLLRADRSWMRIELYDDTCYTFPIGWCLEKARAAVARHKAIKSWE